MDKDLFIEGDAIAFQEAITNFIKVVKEAWGENHMTHYMVCIFNFISLLFFFCAFPYFICYILNYLQFVHFSLITLE